jgi:hypothetical protein
VTFPGALAALTFGKYEALDGQLVEDERAVWVGMITSDTPGEGGRLLDALTRCFGKLELALIGTPVALKPRDWDPGRAFEVRPEVLIGWYLRHGFKMIQSGSETRMVHVPRSAMLQAQFTLA